MRIGGLASGMDIDTMVSDLMKAERTKVDKLEQSKQILLWKQEMYNDLNKELANFVLETKKEFGLTSTTSTGVLLSNSVSSMDWVKMASVSDSTIAGATARAGAVKGSYTLTVTSLAVNWSSASSSAISSGDKGNVASQFGLAAGDTLNFTITNGEGKSVTINKTNLSGVTMSEIVSEINAAKIGVTAIYDSEADRFFLQTDKTGAGNSVTISDASTTSEGNPLQFITGADSVLKLNYLDENGAGQVVEDGVTYAGRNAVFNFGAAVGIEMSSNQFTMNGINFDLKKTGGPVTVEVKINTEEVYAKIEKFVEKYNELIDRLNSLLSEKVYRDYQPLTQEQKDAMTEDQIEKWETMAKSGLIKNDMVVEKTLQTIRSGMYQAVSGVSGSFDHLTDLGITTEGYTSGSMGGKLTIVNKNKLVNAIEEDVDGVLELFFKEPDAEYKYKSESAMTGSELAAKRSSSGLVSRLYDNVVAGMKGIISKSGTGDNASLYRNVSSSILVDFVTQNGSISYLDRDLDRIETKIDVVNDYLVMVEDRYWSKFTAMEQAMQQMNIQSTWLAQQFGLSNS